MNNKLTLALSSVLLITLTACGGGGGGGSDSGGGTGSGGSGGGVTVNSVYTSYPADGETGVPVNAVLWVRFSGDMDGSSIDESSVQLRDGNGLLINSTVSTYLPDYGARIYPDNLDPSTTYTITLDDTIAYQSGSNLSESTFSFTTEPLDWDTDADYVENDRSMLRPFTLHPDLAMNASGDGVVVYTWRDYDINTPDTINVWANVYDADTGWGVEQLIETDNTDDAGEFPKVAIDPAGNAIAVWGQANGDVAASLRIWANVFDVVSGWGTPTPLQSSDVLANVPQIAMDANGNGVAAWYQINGSDYEVWVNRYVKNSGWQGAEKITGSEGSQVAGALDGSGLSLGIDDAGNAMLMWMREDLGVSYVSSSYYSNGVGWTNTLDVDSMTGGDNQRPRVVFDSSGNAHAVWAYYKGLNIGHDLKAARYINGTGWGAPELIESFTQTTVGWRFGDLAINSEDEVYAVWIQPMFTTEEWLMVTRYSPSEGWGINQFLGLTDPGDMTFSLIKFDENDNPMITVLVEANNGERDIWYYRPTKEALDAEFYSDNLNRYVVARGIVRGQGALEPVFTRTIPRYDIAAGDNGEFMALWSQEYTGGTNDRYDLYYKMFD